MYICINCEKLTGANFVDNKWRCPTCGSHVLTPDSDKANSLRKLLCVQPRRVVVTEEQSRKMTDAHNALSKCVREASDIEVKLTVLRREIAHWEANIDAVMAEINGEAVS